MEFRGKRAARAKNPGFYLAMGLCAAAVCLVAISSYINGRADNNDVGSIVSEQTNNTISYMPADTESEVEDGALEFVSEYSENDNSSFEEMREIADTTPYREAPDEEAIYDADGMAEVDAPTEEKAVPVLASPTSGAVIKNFSGTELVYCATMCDWRVHEGLDIAAEAGSEVKAAANGVVMDFVNDPLYGYTVVVNQSDDSIMYYCGLSSTCMASAGLQVNTGDVIGYVGEVPCEARDGSHIHLAMMKDGKFVDPAQYM